MLDHDRYRREESGVAFAMLRGSARPIFHVSCLISRHHHQSLLLAARRSLTMKPSLSCLLVNSYLCLALVSSFSPSREVTRLPATSSALFRRVTPMPTSLRDTVAAPRLVPSAAKISLPRLSWPSLFRRVRTMRRFVVKLALSLVVVFSCHASTAMAAPSGARHGGSFGARSRSVPTRSYPGRSYGRSQPNAPRIVIQRPYTTRLYSTSTPVVYERARATRFTLTDLVTLGLVGGLIARGFMPKERPDDEPSPLGPGATAASITVALTVPNRESRASILKRLQLVCDRTDTSRRASVQNMVAEGTSRPRLSVYRPRIVSRQFDSRPRVAAR